MDQSEARHHHEQYFAARPYVEDNTPGVWHLPIERPEDWEDDDKEFALLPEITARTDQHVTSWYCTIDHEQTLQLPCQAQRLISVLVDGGLEPADTKLGYRQDKVCLKRPPRRHAVICVAFVAAEEDK